MRERLLTLDDERHVDGAPGAHKPANPTRDAALRTVERHADACTPRALDRLDLLIRKGGELGQRYIAAVGSDAYASAWFKLFQDPQLGFARFSSTEHNAMDVVAKVQSERAIVEGTPGDGGFAVPMALDPTLIIASDGAACPIRQLASVITVANTNLWRGVSSTGVTSSYAAEAAPVADESPALLQPEVYIEKAHTFVAFSHELGGDWPGLVAELGKLFADSRDALESEQFLLGRGHAFQEPEGLLTGATVTLNTAVASTFSADDVYALLNAVPARFSGRASVLANQAVYDIIYRMYNPTGEEPPLILPDGSLLSRPKFAWSDMSTAVGTPGELVMVAGDLSTFRIVERVGMSVELIPNLIGATFTPTGQRGLYAWWRNSSAVLVPNAIRVLKIKA